jgi:hypothetical protein
MQLNVVYNVYVAINRYIVGTAVVRNVFMIKFMVSRHPEYLLIIVGNKAEKRVAQI